ncbi:MAG: hypothetical protein IT385_29630 [Deltaproteobacteria bacterium]|nr:hypothetical protein [Deltaproteobacteria bacterium]
MRSAWSWVVALGIAGCLGGDDEAGGLGQSDVTSGVDGLDGLDGQGPGEGECLADEDCEGAFDDLGACEVAMCQTSTGQCLVARAPDLTTCDDGDACTSRSFCNGGFCEAFPSDTIDCDDDDPCTIDTCADDGSCRHSADPGCEPELCGNDVCDAGEREDCPEDCDGGGGGGQVGCGDGQCDLAALEFLVCPEDCGGGGGGGGAGGCNDGVCDQATFESVWCPQDCGGGGGGGGGNCGNGTCDLLERATCPGDCPGGCGDGVCHQGEQFLCNDDCAEGNPDCGDGACEAPEDATICPDDCP